MCVWLVFNQIHSLDKCSPFVKDARHCLNNEDRVVCRGQSSLPLGVAHLIKGHITYWEAQPMVLEVVHKVMIIEPDSGTSGKAFQEEKEFQQKVNKTKTFSHTED